MKNTLPIGIALASLLGLALAQAPAQDPPVQDQDIEKRVDALEAEVATLQAELSAAKTTLEETTRYLAGAKARSEALLKTFDESQDQGFTAGINFKSRETLLAGFRAYAKGESEGLPGAKKKAANGDAE